MREASTTLPPEGAAQGASLAPTHNHTMEGERSEHTGHDDVSTVDGGTVAGNPSPL
jgi:hypothetical protein